MKASGVTKCVKKKWSMASSMEQKTFPSNIPRSSNSVVQVDGEIHFVVDSNDLDYSSAIPNEKSIELSRRTYSKKNPIVYPVTRETTGTYRTDLSLKSKPRLSLPASSERSLQRKRRREFDLENSRNSTPKKLQRKNLQSKVKNAPQSCPPKVLKQQRNKSPPTNCDSSSDSDVEIIAVKMFKSVTLQEKPMNSSFKKYPIAQTSFNNKKKNKYFNSEVNMSEVLINEADIAPTMPSNPDTFPDVTGSSNSMRWLSAKGTISLPGFSSRNLTPLKTMEAPKNAGTSVKNTVQQSVSPEMKAVQEKISKGSRELESLYKNLDEISWTRENGFKNLLRNPERVRHSERSKGRIPGSGKNLRKLKAAVENKIQPKSLKRSSAANAIAKKKSKMARLSHKLKVKSITDSKMSPTMKNKLAEKQAVLNGVKRKANVKNKASKKEFEEETDVRYMLNPNAPKVKLALPKVKAGLSKPKSAVSKTKIDKIKIDDVPKIKTETSPKVMKLKPDGPKNKSTVFKVKHEGLKAKPDITKLKSYVPVVKKRDSPPSTSGIQKIACNSKNVPSAAHSKYYGKSPAMSHVLNNFDSSFHFSNEMQVVQDYLDPNDDVYSAFQKGSKLRVRLQPLEHTKLWTDEFYEEFRKHILNQALLRAHQNRDDSANVMYQELLESLMTSQSSNNNSGNNNRVIKKKKVEEEVLRSSVRQSEGAFRYKEIVVKKHPNYMQVVLVPNEVKQNSLTLEAMKELKDAFLLAKKDPNCRAVLLNSSGPYFCSGIDLRPLVGNNKKQAAEDLSNSVRDLVLTLGMFTKPVIAAVNGATLGFGVSILTFCDVVLASDKATFCLPATKIGYMPEGGITLTLPQVVGSSVASEMFLQGRRLTAEQACRYGLVSEVIWPTKLMNEVIPRLQTIISQPLQAMEATKTMVRCNLWDKLKTHVDRERRLICEHWLSAQCQSNIKSLLQTGWLYD